MWMAQSQRLNLTSIQPAVGGGPNGQQSQVVYAPLCVWMSQSVGARNNKAAGVASHDTVEQSTASIGNDSTGSPGATRIMWSNEEIANIIQEVRDRPFLYDKKHSDYKHHQKKEMAWDTIAAKMQNSNLTGESSASAR